jgi:hypothetical protein
MPRATAAARSVIVSIIDDRPAPLVAALVAALTPWMLQ